MIAMIQLFRLEYQTTKTGIIMYYLFVGKRFK